MPGSALGSKDARVTKDPYPYCPPEHKDTQNLSVITWPLNKYFLLAWCFMCTETFQKALKLHVTLLH